MQRTNFPLFFFSSLLAASEMCLKTVAFGFFREYNASHNNRTSCISKSILDASRNNTKYFAGIFISKPMFLMIIFWVHKCNKLFLHCIIYEIDRIHFSEYNHQCLFFIKYVLKIELLMIQKNYEGHF